MSDSNPQLGIWALTWTTSALGARLNIVTLSVEVFLPHSPTRIARSAMCEALPKPEAVHCRKWRHPGRPWHAGPGTIQLS